MDDSKTLSLKKTFLLTREGLENLRARLDDLLERRLGISQQLRTHDSYERDDALITEEQISALERAEIEAVKLSNILSTTRRLLPKSRILRLFKQAAKSH